jgi:hypothetical protein
VWAINVVVVDVLVEEGMQVSLVDDDRVVQTLRAYRAHDALADGVRAGGPDRCPYGRDAELGQPGAERAAVDIVAVVDEVFGLPSPGGRPDQLLPDPSEGTSAP